MVAKISENEFLSFEFIVTVNRNESYIEGMSICFPFTFKRCPHLCTDGNIQMKMHFDRGIFLKKVDKMCIQTFSLPRNRSEKDGNKKKYHSSLLFTYLFFQCHPCYENVMRSSIRTFNRIIKQRRPKRIKNCKKFTQRPSPISRSIICHFQARHSTIR